MTKVSLHTCIAAHNDGHTVLRVKARTNRLFSLIFGRLVSKPKALDCAIKTTKMCSLSVFEGEERFVSTRT